MLKKTGGRVAKAKFTSPHRNWPLYAKNSIDHTAPINGYPFIVLPKTYGVHAYKTKAGLVSEAGKMIQLDQANALAEPLPVGTDVYLVIGDPRHEHAMTQSNRIGSMRSGTDRVDLRIYVNDFRSDGNWIDRMQRFHGHMGDVLPTNVLSMFDIGQGAWTISSLHAAETHFLAQGYDAVELRRVCPPYVSGKITTNLQMLRRYKRRVAYPIEWGLGKDLKPVVICSFADPTPTGGKVVKTFRFRLDDEILPHKELPPIRLLVHNTDVERDAPAFNYFYHGLVDNPMCTGARCIHDWSYDVQTLIR